jgi:hypothetical protein
LKIVFFSPHSAIWVHSFPEALVAEALQQAGHQIVYIGCGRAFDHCICMTASRVAPHAASETRSAICDTCESRKNILLASFGFPNYDMSSVLDEQLLADANEIVAKATPENFLGIVVDEVEVGRAALSTYLLSYKRINLRFTRDEWSVFAVELHNTIRSVFAGRKILDHERPDRVILYSSGYSVNLVWCLLAERRGIPFYYMNAGSNLSDRLQKLVISRGHSLQRKLLDYWPAYRAIPCGAKAASYITDHFIELLRGRHVFVYSVPKRGDHVDLRKFFGVNDGQRVLVAAMSSYDELYAAQVTGLFPDDFSLIFPMQIDWLRALIKFMENRSDLFLVIRVHPREFPNKRDPVKSAHALELEEVLSALPPNVRVNWPHDEVSLYDLAQIMDVCLNSWSTAGKEMATLGIPVVIYSADLVFYPPDLNYLGQTVDDYFMKIEQAIADGWSAERIRSMYRWLALEDMYSRIDISDSYSHKENSQRSIAVRIVDRIRREIYPDFRERDDCRNRSASLQKASLVCKTIEGGYTSILETLDVSGIPRITIDEETAVLKREVGRIVEAMYGPDMNGQNRQLQGSLARHLISFATASLDRSSQSDNSQMS